MERVLEAVEFRQRSDIHWARKLWHMTGVSLMAGLYAWLPEQWSLALIAIAWLAFVPVDFVRLRVSALNKALLSLFRPIMRESEIHRLAGTTYLLTGTLLVILIFPSPIALLTLLFLAFADPIASYFGIRFGKDKILGEKSLQGSLAAFVVCALLTFVYLRYHAVMVDRLFVVSILAGLAGALAELIPVGKLDDNLTLPILSGGALWILFSLFGVFSAYV
ncbi:MAG: hypothetical protein COT73_04635 [Bdellovibrio sp. CG10_big_fil_rev_8_21_14_0_10_47_8]|nr:MAG: hypothetical protein COT73_04635 [Bdellovibrio sp. CG10_big_fil_rev_8_21_14_0_10_47_8]